VPLARRALPSARLVHATRAAHAEETKPAAAGSLSLTFTLPKACLYDTAPVEMVILPGVDGIFGVMPNHVPTIAELKPGVVSVQETAGGPLTKYFVSGGFASSAPAPSCQPCSRAGGDACAGPLPYQIVRPTAHAPSPCGPPPAIAVGPDSKLSVSTLMASPVEDLDPEAIKQGLAQ
jgi:F-type H+-transporting ATPase subunit delta